MSRHRFTAKAQTSMEPINAPTYNLVHSALERARSWTEAETYLALIGLHLRPRLFSGGGVYLTDADDNQWPVSAYWPAGVTDLASKYNATFAEHSRRLFAGYAKVLGTTPEELRRRERL